jgi:hypothetical protein
MSSRRAGPAFCSNRLTRTRRRYVLPAVPRKALADALQLLILPTDYKIPELNYPQFTRAACDRSMDPHYSIEDDAPATAERKPNYSLFATPTPLPQKRIFTRLKRPLGMASRVGPATGSTLLSVPAAKALRRLRLCWRPR